MGYFDRTFQGGDYDAPARRFTENPPEWAPRHANGACGGGSSGSGAGVPRPAAVPPKSEERSRRATVPGSNVGAVSGGGGAYPQTIGMAHAGSAQAYNAAVGASTAAIDDEQDRLREEVVDLKITVDGLETERDFYFQKLRDIEILCQALQANPDPHMTTSKFVEDVQRILYAKDEEDDGNDGDGNGAHPAA